MSQQWQFESFDFDTVWTALGRSKQLKKALEQVAEDVQKEAESYARSVAYDNGDYQKSFGTASASGTQSRNAFNNRARRRRAKQGANRFVRGQVFGTSKNNRKAWVPAESNGDPDGGAYAGTIATVFNAEFTAVWVEFGSLAKGPRRVMTTSAKKVVSSMGGAADLEIIYDANYKEDHEALGKAIAAGYKRKRDRESGTEAS